MFSRARFLALLTLLFLACAARAEIAAEASISATQVGTGEPFQLTVQVVTDQKDVKLPWPQVENLTKYIHRLGLNFSTRCDNSFNVVGKPV